MSYVVKVLGRHQLLRGITDAVDFLLAQDPLKYVADILAKATPTGPPASKAAVVKHGPAVQDWAKWKKQRLADITHTHARQHRTPAPVSLPGNSGGNKGEGGRERGKGMEREPE